MIAEFELNAQILRPSLTAAPNVTLTLEQLYSTPEEPLRNVFWAVGEGVDAFEAALPDDDSITDWVRLETTEIGRLYRVTYVPDLLDVQMYAVVGAVDALVLNATAKDGRYELRMRFPDRDAFDTFRRESEELGAELTLLSLYTVPGERLHDEQVLTDTQYETLVSAFEQGYFEIPRRVSLNELASQFEVSDQAISERLRRGTHALVGNTLVYDSGDETQERFISDER